MLERADLTTSTWLGDVLAGKPVLVPDREAFATEHPTARALQLYPAGSWVVLPFRTEGSVGMLSLHYLTPQPLQDFELYFSLLAELLSTSLARSSSEAARRRELRELERSFAERDRIARTLSTSLIPTVLPDLPGFRTDHWLEPASADQVAGDFYDLFTVGHGDWIAVLGDVSGKGAEAAAVTSLARYAARTSALSRPDPLSVVDLVDRALTADSSDLYCTMVVVRWCSDQEELQVALAGHHPARLITDDGVQRVGAFGSAAGLDMGSFRLDTAAFHHGDVLLLFSDGLIERDPAFGEDELDELLASAPRDPGELVRHLQRHVERLAVVHPDDIAVLALQRSTDT
jgi:sigma-B regulation protein RsbU (phosphoserine phosphatase)